MFDASQLFKVLYSIHLENNYFLLAQDLYCTFSGVLSQFAGLENIIDEFNSKIESLTVEGGKIGDIEKYRQSARLLSELLSERSQWEHTLTELVEESRLCWYCAPVDSDRNASQNTEAMEKWIFYSKGSIVEEDVQLKLDSIKAKCLNIVKEKFPEMLVEATEEIAQEEEIRLQITNTKFKFLGNIPAGLQEEVESSNNSFLVISAFPTTHYFAVEPKFARTLKYSRARMLALPLISFIVNTKETNSIVSSLNTEESTTPSTVILFYRTATRHVLGVHWELCNTLIDGCIVARGVDITSELSLARSSQAENMQTLLRQWLHSIRNASFEQQAQMIHDHVKELRDRLAAKLDEESRSEFDGIMASLRTLMYTAHSSIGLIDQALATRGVISYVTMRAFVDSLASFAPNFAQSEGIENFTSQFNAYLNGSIVNMRDLESLYVSGDMASLKVLIDNIYSNAVRYTDPTKGVDCDVHLHIHGNILQCAVNITDHCPGGLPSKVIKYFQDNISIQKVTDLRCDPGIGDGLATCSHQSQRLSSLNIRNSVKKEEPFDDRRNDGILFSPRLRHSSPSPSDTPPTPSRSSLTGVPHIVELYHTITESGEQDFDMAIVSKCTGTSYSMRFAANLIAPPSFEPSPPADKGAWCDKYARSVEGKKVLAVDDSMVVRRLLAHFFAKLNIPCQICVDGLDALEWLRDNSDICVGVITDIEMPKMGGDTLIQEIKAIWPNLACVVVSGNFISSELIPRGAMSVLLKPISIRQLQEVLIDIFEEHQKHNSN